MQVKVSKKILSIIFVALFGFMMAYSPAVSAGSVVCPDGTVIDLTNASGDCSNNMGAPPSSDGDAGTGDCRAQDLNSGNCGIVKHLVTILNLFSGLVGVVVVAMIIVGGIQYSTAGGDSQKVAKAKGKIFNALLAFVAYIFTFSFLQWIVPGGIFN